MILFGLILSMVIAMPLMSIFSMIPAVISPMVSGALASVGAPFWLTSLLGDAVMGALSFTLMMVSFVIGVSLVFGFIEEVGYMAHISFVFDNTMSKLGLQGKAIMPFLVSLGCNIGGVAGTRVIDSWPQRVLAISVSWVVPCASTWAVVGMMSSLFFGSNALWVVVALFLVAFLHMAITAKVFGRKLITKENRTGLIMELPPYHKPRFRNLLRFVQNRLWDVFGRALKIILVVAVLFWALSYTADGDITGSVIYKIGTFIEPVTMWFGLRWELFMAWLASAMGKEGALGVLSSLFNISGDTGYFSAIITQKTASVSEAALSSTLLQSITAPEALSFIFAFFFNIPCLMTIAATKQETHSWKWTLSITAYYLVASLLISTVVYHVSGLFLG